MLLTIEGGNSFRELKSNIRGSPLQAVNAVWDKGDHEVALRLASFFYYSGHEEMSEVYLFLIFAYDNSDHNVHAHKLIESIKRKPDGHFNWFTKIPIRHLFTAAQWVLSYHKNRIDIKKFRAISEMFLAIEQIQGGADESVFRFAARFAETAEMSAEEIDGFWAIKYAKSGHVNQAFEIILSRKERINSIPALQMAAHELFNQATNDNKAQIFDYSKEGVKNTGIAVISGLGVICKEFSGKGFSTNNIGAKTSVAFSPVTILDKVA